MTGSLWRPAHRVAGGMALMRFAERRSQAGSPADVERVFLAARLCFFDAPIYGFNVRDAEGALHGRGTRHRRA